MWPFGQWPAGISLCTNVHVYVSDAPKLSLSCEERPSRRTWSKKLPFHSCVLLHAATATGGSLHRTCTMMSSVDWVAEPHASRTVRRKIHMPMHCLRLLTERYANGLLRATWLASAAGW